MLHELIGRVCFLQPAHYLPGLTPKPRITDGHIIDVREPGIVRVRDRDGRTHDRVQIIADGQQQPPLGLWCRLDKYPASRPPDPGRQTESETMNQTIDEWLFSLFFGSNG